ncbi:LacI family DNA-binding transcriptional regulator [Paracidovorax wautersii]|uniref:LacI family gluconate utilization system Gnt-I transcriptional repressor n=1 Tax=Paracidovorax wautersii TaxID=1177982 RepID=A0ABU1IEF0_9BURK|nr:LacI family DNA-binding transcriptional regulator [Paracidovorax wautersii]MDR6215346.1 LacI family gluconate utilization system Gnt-I transcriptional repressor [Paracidovorax wautersii]
MASSVNSDDDPTTPQGVPPPAPVPAAAPPRRRGSGHVTIRDVAQLAGVAPMTVSRALSNPQQVSEAVRERVRAAVASSGYVPNLIAGALSSGHSRLVAALVPTISTLTLHPLLEALGRTLEPSGCQLLLGQTGYDNARLDGILETVLGRRPAGIVITGTLESATWRQRLRASGVPVVETWDLVDDPIDMLVGFSHADMAGAVVRFLHAGGRRRLAFFGADDARSRARAHAFQGAALALGMPAPLLHAAPAPATLRSGRDALSQLMAGASDGPPVDGVFCNSDLMAMGVLIEAQQRGVAVPGQLAVVGCGDLPFSADFEPALTTVHLDGAAIGTRAGELLLERLQGGAAPAGATDLGFSIRQRATA